MSEDLEYLQQREEIAVACRIMAMEGLVDGTLGHISMRVGENRMLIKARSPHDEGLFLSSYQDIVLVDFSGQLLEADRGVRNPAELPLHGESLRARPQANVVLHAHPRAVLTATLAGLKLLPAFGAYNIPAAALASKGIPVYERSVLIADAQVAQAMLGVMGEAPAVILYGHGITVIGDSIPSAVIRALAINTLAQVALDVAFAGGTLRSISDEDLNELPDLGASFNEIGAYRHFIAKARSQGLIP